MDMVLLLQKIRETKKCRVDPPAGMPVVQRGAVLPDDLRLFYQLCGGVDLFRGTYNHVSIVAPSKVVPANPVIRIGLTEEELNDGKYDKSKSWYIISDMGSGQYITIDLNPQRIGRCYDSFWDIHPFNSRILAFSFTELLTRLLETKGKASYRDDWETYGFAYLIDKE